MSGIKYILRDTEVMHRNATAVTAPGSHRNCRKPQACYRCPQDRAAQIQKRYHSPKKEKKPKGQRRYRLQRWDNIDLDHSATQEATLRHWHHKTVSKDEANHRNKIMVRSSSLLPSMYSSIYLRMPLLPVKCFRRSFK